MSRRSLSKLLTSTFGRPHLSLPSTSHKSPLNSVIHNNSSRYVSTWNRSIALPNRSFPRFLESNTLVQRRNFFVNTENTPNPESLKFVPGEQKVLPSGTLDFPDARSANISPLAKLLFKQEGVKRVFLTSDYVTITKDENIEWEQMKPVVIGTLMEFYASGQPVVLDAKDLPQDTKILESDSESVAMIKELLETRIRPAVQDDGGDITFLGFTEGVVFLLMQGSCSGCPSSSVTLKSGIERMLMHWVPEVQGVMAVDSREEYERVIGKNPTASDSQTGTAPDEILKEAKQQSESRKASEEALDVLEKRLKSAGDGLGNL